MVRNNKSKIADHLFTTELNSSFNTSSLIFTLEGTLHCLRNSFTSCIWCKQWSIYCNKRHGHDARYVAGHTTHLMGPNLKGLVDRGEFLQWEMWEFGTCLLNHLKKVERYQSSTSYHKPEAVSLASHGQWCTVGTPLQHQSCRGGTFEGRCVDGVQWHLPAAAEDWSISCTQCQMSVG